MSRIEIRPYDGNLEALRSLARLSWTAEYANHKGSSSWPDLYTTVLSQYYFEAGYDPRLLAAAYLDGEIVGFLANLPRKYRFRGRPLSGMLTTLLAVHPQVPAVLGLLLADCLRGSEEFGADLSLFLLEKNHRTAGLSRTLRAAGGPAARQAVSLTAMWPLAHAVDFPAIRVHEGLSRLEAAAMKVWGAHRPILSGRPPGEVRPCRPADLPGVLALTEQVPDHDQVVRVFDLPGLERRFTSGVLSEKLGGMVVYEHRRELKGFLSFSIYDMVTARGAHPWAWIDLVCWEACSAQEKQALIAGAWALGRARGCIGVLVWTKQRISYRAFYRAGFFPYPRPLDLQAGILNPSISLQGAEGAFEQMI